MIYLAEIQKKHRKILCSSQTELVLFACLLNSKDWSILSKPKTINIKKTCFFSKGTLVIVNIVNETKIVGEIEVAKPYILNILQEKASLANLG